MKVLTFAAYAIYGMSCLWAFGVLVHGYPVELSISWKAHFVVFLAYLIHSFWPYYLVGGTIYIVASRHIRLSSKVASLRGQVAELEASLQAYVASRASCEHTTADMSGDVQVPQRSKVQQALDEVMEELRREEIQEDKELLDHQMERSAKAKNRVLNATNASQELHK